MLDHGTKILLNIMFSSHYNYYKYFVCVHLSDLGFSGPVRIRIVQCHCAISTRARHAMQEYLLRISPFIPLRSQRAEFISIDGLHKSL